MSQVSDAAVGRLAIMDGALNSLLRDLIAEAATANATDVTTGKAAQLLLRELKPDPTLLTSAVRDWLLRVIEAARQRNEIMHAVATDQCVICGKATQFEHKGKAVDRSEAAVTAVSAEFKALIDEGFGHARDISVVLNSRQIAAAKAKAAATGTIQGPKQILIGGQCTVAANVVVPVRRH
jgi:hypothetical protein